jgi:hypothetical protein
MKRLCLAIALVSLAVLPSMAFEIDSLSLHLHLASLKRAQAPEVLEGYLILTAKGPYRSVAAAFDNEGFTRLHAYERNEQGVFVLALPLPLKRSEPLAYRMVVDGTWMADPMNPLRAEGRAGVELSLAMVPYLTDEKAGLYRIMDEDGRTAHFLFKGEPGMVVTVAGTFNNWDPFLYEMRETSPGVYRLDVVLTAGTHYYAFYYLGDGHPDPLNEDKASDRAGRVFSVLSVPGAPR